MTRLPRRLLLPAVLLVALIQTALAGKMILDRAALLRTGTEVTLQTGFIDPRDLFRGHYAVLNLMISQVPAASIPAPVDLVEGAAIWAELTPGEDGFWTVAALHADPARGTGGPLLQGELQGKWQDIYNLGFPIDRFFAPEDRALELESLRAEQRLGVIVALSPRGAAAIKGLTIDGQRLYEEPLY